MVYQQISGDRTYPGDEGPFGMVVAGKSAVHLDEDLLGEVLGVVGRSRKSIANVVNTPGVSLHDFLPGGGVAGNTSPNQHRNDLDVLHLRSPEIVLLRRGLDDQDRRPKIRYVFCQPVVRSP